MSTDPTSKPAEPPSDPGRTQPAEQDLTSGEPVVEHVVEHMVPFWGKIQQDFGNVIAAMDAEAAADQTMQEEFLKRPDAVQAGVDLSAIKGIDPQFDEHQFISISREVFEIVHAARAKRDAGVSAQELTPEVDAALKAAIAQDQAHNRLHLFPGIEIEDAKIAAAKVDGGKEIISTHYVVKGEEMERDARTLSVLTGTDAVLQWEEVWTFARDPSVDSSSIDHQMTLMASRWYFNHLGWMVSTIQTTTGPSPIAPD
ncbi:MAG TPA: Tim44-like domain-containing protein [Verrucomicrobiae bacterium]|nr:Tim44-like domain-containing protein [Verrucomicrobiae bacterium]